MTAAELQAIIQAASRPPQAKYKLPATTSQEVGWFAAQASPEPFRVRKLPAGACFSHFFPTSDAAQSNRNDSSRTRMHTHTSSPHLLVCYCEYACLHCGSAQAVHPSCDEVAYAESYYDSFRCGPFDKTQPVARSR
jgi:hypothetical protein